MKKYRVHCGYTIDGRNRWKMFDSIESAKEFCAKRFAEDKTVLTVESITLAD